MLILSRKLNESIVIDGRIVIKVLRIDKDAVKLGIQAPIELSVHRQEIFDLIQRARNKDATNGNDNSPSLPPAGAAPASSD
jgi:carbon storage regulator